MNIFNGYFRPSKINYNIIFTHLNIFNNANCELLIIFSVWTFLEWRSEYSYRIERYVSFHNFTGFHFEAKKNSQQYYWTDTCLQQCQNAVQCNCADSFIFATLSSHEDSQFLEYVPSSISKNEIETKSTWECMYACMCV